jgi:hypothetical protein
MRRKPVHIDTKANQGPTDLSPKLANQFSGNDATVTQYAGSRESMAMETVPGEAANKRALQDKLRKKGDRRTKRLRSENRVPTSQSPGAYSSATAFHPSGARY